MKFIERHQCGPRTLAAFEKSEYADDWRELMRLFLVRRTRSFIQENYALTDPENGAEVPSTFEDGRRSYFPTRVPKTVKFKIDDTDSTDQYALLYSDAVVDDINKLTLPRYGLGNYLEQLAYRAAQRGGEQELPKPLAGREAADGFLPHQPLQAVGEQRARVRAVRRAALAS